MLPWKRYKHMIDIKFNFQNNWKYNRIELWKEKISGGVTANVMADCNKGDKFHLNWDNICTTAGKARLVDCNGAPWLELSVSRASNIFSEMIRTQGHTTNDGKNKWLQ